MPGATNITTTEVTAEPEEQQDEGPELWNRWLLICQLLLAPLFIVFAIYSQSPTDITPRWLLKPCLICLLISLVLLIPLLLTTTPTHKPAAFRHILSLVGFVVSISWISTIASQVVGALKALAVILNMSHAIMGLTIFAVGNSLGDLVADVTVARLGYPVMALSACFGGPMLNILLGIGLSGSYILIRGANERMHKHPDKDYKFKPYHIEVENTLIVSGATLLVTLAGLLVAVPLNKWVLSKRIGWALIALWTVSTIGNVVIEVTGLNKGKEELVGVMW
jgi:sodium/potassium/calcium exchanger 6